MKVLIVGNGGREHAIAWKLRQSIDVDEIFVAPGNPGTTQSAWNVPIEPSNIEDLLGFAQREHIDITVVGPEGPLAAGIADRFEEEGLLLFGPTKNAALIESSKGFAKELMLRHRIPTATSKIFSSYSPACEYALECTFPIVIKADGLAAGKGVVVAENHSQATETLRLMMEEKQFGNAGERVLIEEYLDGQEISVFAFVDGKNCSSMVAACDYKLVGDGNTGPNTGGMGSYSPPLIWNATLERRVRTEIMEPIVDAMADHGSPYRGILYAGLMLTTEGPKVLEFNCRFGDPEAQVILPRLKTDLAQVIMMTALGKLEDTSIEWDSSACVAVVIASAGYPAKYSTGYTIRGLKCLDDEVTVFHAGTKAITGQGKWPSKILTAGGRVLTVMARGTSLIESRRKVYSNVERISFEGSFYRKDIASL